MIPTGQICNPAAGSNRIPTTIFATRSLHITQLFSTLRSAAMTVVPADDVTMRWFGVTVKGTASSILSCSSTLYFLYLMKWSCVECGIMWVVCADRITST